MKYTSEEQITPHNYVQLTWHKYFDLTYLQYKAENLNIQINRKLKKFSLIFTLSWLLLEIEFLSQKMVSFLIVGHILFNGPLCSSYT